MTPSSTWKSVLQQIDTMDIGEQLNLMRYLVDKLQQSNTLQEKRGSPSLVSLMGSGKGCYDAPEAADQFLRKERDEWD